VAPGENEDPRKQLGLHFDLTVPFARYVLEYAGQLTFPFKRYQIQKVWRGERPQEGRFREFIQADIDVVGDGKLPLHYDAELPLIMHEALSALPIPPVLLHVSNRKVAQGFYTTIGVAEESLIEVLRVVDKLDKIGPEAVAQELEETVGLSSAQARLALQMAEITASNGEELEEKLRALLEQAGLEANELLEQGIAELAGVLEVAARRRPGALIADLKIARGLDYYTGTVYESELIGHEDLGSICSGGRYDSLASNGKRSFPGFRGCWPGLLALAWCRLAARYPRRYWWRLPTRIRVRFLRRWPISCAPEVSALMWPPLPQSSASRLNSLTSAVFLSYGSQPQWMRPTIVGLIRLRTSVLVSKLRPTPPLGSAPSGICACR